MLLVFESQMFFDCSIFAVLVKSFVDRVPCHANVRRCKKLAIFFLYIYTHTHPNWVSFSFIYIFIGLLPYPFSSLIHLRRSRTKSLEGWTGSGAEEWPRPHLSQQSRASRPLAEAGLANPSLGSTRYFVRKEGLTESSYILNEALRSDSVQYRRRLKKTEVIWPQSSLDPSMHQSHSGKLSSVFSIETKVWGKGVDGLFSLL